MKTTQPESTLVPNLIFLVGFDIAIRQADPTPLQPGELNVRLS
jgi:hypothetical protein